MKSVMFAVFAALVAFSFPVTAAEKPAQQANSASATESPMTPEECTKQMTACGSDQACKDKLVAKGCKAS